MMASSLPETLHVGVKCAWCGKIIHAAPAPPSMTTWSHGMCGECLSRYMVELKAGRGKMTTSAAACRGLHI